MRFPYHIIDGSKIECKICNHSNSACEDDDKFDSEIKQKSAQNELPIVFNTTYQSKKIFLGGLSPCVDECKYIKLKY